MAGYLPNEETPFYSPYEHPSSDAESSPLNFIPSPGDIQYHYHCSHAGGLSPTHNDLYNTNGLYTNYDCDDSYGSHGATTENDPALPSDGAYVLYTAGALRKFGPVPPTIIPTAFYPTSASSSPVNDTYYGPPSYPPPALPFASPSTPRQGDELSDPQATPSDHELLCLWGTPTCGQILADRSSATLRAHLRDAHGVGLGAGTHNAKRASARCLWGGQCSANTEHILVSGMAKHVATCHLKSTSLSCASCGQVCSRADALKRHAQLYCPASKQVEGYKPERRRSQGGSSSQRELGWD